jgi:hypothetical protein
MVRARPGVVVAEPDAQGAGVDASQAPLLDEAAGALLLQPRGGQHPALGGGGGAREHGEAARVPGRRLEDACERGPVRGQDLEPAHDDLEQSVVGVAVDGLLLERGEHRLVGAAREAAQDIGLARGDVGQFGEIEFRFRRDVGHAHVAPAAPGGKGEGGVDDGVLLVFGLGHGQDLLSLASWASAMRR